MKHPEELKTKFLELRARDVSYTRIAAELGVSKPTLIQWGKDMAEEIADLQAAERELVREKLLGNFEQWLGRQVHHFNRLDAEFGRRELKYSPTESVFRMMMASGKLLDRYFFEDNRPRQRRASEQRAPSSPLGPAPSPLPAERTAEVQNPSKTQPLPDRNNGGTTAGASDKHNATGVETTEVANQPSETDTGENSVAGKFISALHRLQAAEADSSEGETNAPETQSQIPNPKSEIESSAPAYSENPAISRPFPGQNSGVHNPALSADQSKIESPNSKITASPQSETPNQEFTTNDQPQLTSHDSSLEDFGGESVPINPFESTRQWPERQGIQASKAPKGARIITG